MHVMRTFRIFQLEIKSKYSPSQEKRKKSLDPLPSFSKLCDFSTNNHKHLTVAFRLTLK